MLAWRWCWGRLCFMSRLHWRLRPHLSWLRLRCRLTRRSTLTWVALLRSSMLHGGVMLRHQLLLLSLLLGLCLRVLLLLHCLILSKLRAQMRWQVNLKLLRISLHSSHLLRVHPLVSAMRETHHSILLHHVLLLMLLLLLLAQHCLALLSLHGQSRILGKHLLLLLLEHVGLRREMRQRVRTRTWTTHSRLHSHHRPSLRNVRSVRTRDSRMHLHRLAHGLTRIWTRTGTHGVTMWNAGLLDTTRMMRICASHHLDL